MTATMRIFANKFASNYKPVRLQQRCRIIVYRKVKIEMKELKYVTLRDKPVILFLLLDVINSLFLRLISRKGFS